MPSFLSIVSVRQCPSLLHPTLFRVIPTANRSPKERKIHAFLYRSSSLRHDFAKGFFTSVCNCRQNFWGIEKASDSCFKAQKIDDMSYTKTTWEVVKSFKHLAANNQMTMLWFHLAVA